MLLNYAVQQPRGYEGQVDGPISHEDTFPRTNPAKAQKGTITIAGTASDGVYSATFVNPADPDVSYVGTFTRANSETNNQIAAALAADLVKKLFLKADVTVATNVITVDMKNADITYTVSTSAPGLGTATWAQTVAAGGSYIPFGRFVAGGGDGVTMRALQSGDTVANVAGVSVRELAVETRGSNTADDGVPPGREGAVLSKGPILMYTEEAVTPADTCYARIIASGTNTEIGRVRKSADGGNAVDVSTIARFDESAAAGSIVRVLVNRPLPPA